MRRVLYLVPSLAGGGAEAQIVQHLRLLPRDRFAPELALFYREGVHLDRVPDDVPIHVLPRRRGPTGLPGRVRALRRLVAERGIDVVASFLWYPHLLNLLAGGRARRVCFVRNDPAALLASGRLPLRQRLGVRLTMFLLPRADRVVVQTPEAVARLRLVARVDEERVAVLPNGIDLAAVAARTGRAPSWPGPGLRLLAIGRLHPDKLYDVLVDAVGRAGIDATLLILGEGEERGRILAAARRAGVAVALPGFVDDPYAALRAADLFVHASRREGFPNALLEALAVGTPAIAADCPTGPRFLLGDGAGVLVPPGDAVALAEAITALGNDPARRAELAARGVERARAFDWTRVIPQLVEILA